MAQFISNDYSSLAKDYDYENKKLNKNKINYVITHGSCPDGFMSATIVKRWLISQKINIDKIIFMNAYYGTDYSNLPDIVKNKYVIICDFSFSEEIIKEMIITTNHNLLILDHHKTALNNLTNIPKEYLLFDMNHSGAFITYTYFFGFVNIPNSVLYIEDNDLWINKMPHTKEITAYISTLYYSFEEYEKLFTNSYIINTVIPLGKGMLLLNNSYVKQIIKNSFVSFIKLNDKYYFVAMCNSPILKNELGNNLLSYYSNIDFSAVYTQNIAHQQTVFSLRSTNEKTDTTEISQLFKGGGHRNASAFMINKITHNFIQELNDFTTYRDLETIKDLIHNDKKYITITTNSKNIKDLLKYLLQNKIKNEYTGSIGININADKILLLLNNEFIEFNNLEELKIYLI